MTFFRTPIAQQWTFVKLTEAVYADLYFFLFHSCGSIKNLYCEILLCVAFNNSLKVMVILGTVRMSASLRHIGHFIWRSGMSHYFGHSPRGCQFHKKKIHNIILIVGGNDVRCATSPEKLAAILESLVSVLHNRLIWIFSDP